VDAQVSILRLMACLSRLVEFIFLADFVFGHDADLSGILAGLEVYGLASEAPKILPLLEALRPLAE
jgi:hypothetical protein